MKDNRLFQTEQQVKDYFFELSRPPVMPPSQKLLDRGVIIDTKLRKQILCGENRGNLILNGCVYSLVFKNLGGGCWNVTIGPLNR